MARMTTEPRDPPSGRERQRRRTARAIVAAAGELLGEGRTPTVAEIAERAEVSRRTVHLHFPTLEQLLVDAGLGLLAESRLEDDLAASRTGDDAEERIAALARAVVRHHREFERLGRTMIRLTVEAPAGRAPRRGGRRLEWIETALEPVRDRLAPAAYERLVSGLAMLIGWEAMLVLWGVRGLGPRQAEETVVWSARSLVRVALESAGPR
jgi:AcrR family transcriptional regulator